jgi:hypothetical protein
VKVLNILYCWIMKKLLLITLISFGWCNVSLSESLGVDKTVNDYLKEGYTLHSTNIAGNGYYLYHLVQGGSKIPLITCAYEIVNNNTICWMP